MNKKTIKYLLIVLSSLYIIIELLIVGPIDKILYITLEFNDNILLLIAIILLLIGIFIEKTDKKIKKTNQIVKYKILKKIGYVPFVLVVLYGIYCFVNGFIFFNTTEYGLSAFFSSIFIISIAIAGPFYIIGMTLIIMSNKKIKQINEKK